MRQLANEAVRRFSIRAHSVAQGIRSLSGGNQQKVAIAQALNCAPRLLLLEEPTRGVDIHSKREIYRLLRDFVGADNAVIMFCTEVLEVYEAADRALCRRQWRDVAGDRRRRLSSRRGSCHRHRANGASRSRRRRRGKTAAAHLERDAIGLNRRRRARNEGSGDEILLVPWPPAVLTSSRKARPFRLLLPDIACLPGNSLPPLLERSRKSVVFHVVERICSCGRERQSRVMIFPVEPINRTKSAKRKTDFAGPPQEGPSSRISKLSRRPLKAYRRAQSAFVSSSTRVRVPTARPTCRRIVRRGLRRSGGDQGTA